MEIHSVHLQIVYEDEINRICKRFPIFIVVYLKASL